MTRSELAGIAWQRLLGAATGALDALGDVRDEAIAGLLAAPSKRTFVRQWFEYSLRHFRERNEQLQQRVTELVDDRASLYDTLQKRTLVLTQIRDLVAPWRGDTRGRHLYSMAADALVHPFEPANGVNHPTPVCGYVLGDEICGRSESNKEIHE